MGDLETTPNEAWRRRRTCTMRPWVNGWEESREQGDPGWEEAMRGDPGKWRRQEPNRNL
jgi:hypothetical protein